MLNLPSTRTIDMPVDLAASHAGDDARSDWRETRPLIAAAGVTLRALRASDAPTLHAMLTAEEVARFISPPPTTVEGFEKFIAWTHRRQAEGRYVCFGILPAGCTHAVGIIHRGRGALTKLGAVCEAVMRVLVMVLVPDRKRERRPNANAHENPTRTRTRTPTRT